MGLRPIYPASHRRCSRLVSILIFIYFAFHDRFMAKRQNDLILRDRLQFTLDGSGDLATVYGRVDLSDYVSVVNNEGLAIKETRVMLRNPSTPTGNLNQNLIGALGAAGNNQASIQMFGSTTAYEAGADVGIGSPNVFFNAYRESSTSEDGAGVITSQDNKWTQYGTPDLHPEGYTVVSDVLIGITAQGVKQYASTTLELDVMLIAEPVKVTKDELKEMLAQATDL